MSKDTPIAGISIDTIDGTTYGIALGGDAIMTSICAHHLRKIAQQFAEVRHLPKREAMHYLTEKMGFCSNTAGRIFLALHSHTHREALH